MTTTHDLPDATAFRSATIVDLLNWRAGVQPDQRAYSFSTDGEMQAIHFTYKELDERARSVAALLQSFVAPGERALLLYPPGLDYIAAFFGCLYAGAIAVPAYPPRAKSIERLLGIIASAQPAVVLTSSMTSPQLNRLFEDNILFQGIVLLCTDDIRDDLGCDWKRPALNGESIAFLQYTSGSTTAPRGVTLTHSNLLSNLEQIRRCFGHTADSRGVIWLPPYHDMGLIGGVLQPLYAGFPVTLMSPLAFFQRPLRWLQAISRTQATTSGGPNFAYDLCVHRITPDERATLDLSSWEVAFNGAEPIRYETLDRFARTFEPYGFRREALYPCYGLAEATLIVSGGVKLTEPRVCTLDAAELERDQVVVVAPDAPGTRALVSCGKTLPNHETAIVDPETFTLCRPDRIGEIWVAGPSVAQGYWNQPEDTEMVFQAYLSDTGHGPYLRTGDLGFLCDLELYVAGRLKDLIIVRGRNHYPQDIEYTAERCLPSLKAISAAAFSIAVAGEEQLVIVQEVERGSRPDLDRIIQAIRRAVAEEHEVAVHAVVLVSRGSIPKTSSGKVQRLLCRSRYLAGTLSTLAVWQAELGSDDQLPEGQQEPDLAATSVAVWLVGELARKLQIDAQAIDVNERISRYGVDSLTAIALMHTVQTRFTISISPDDFLEKSITELAVQLSTAFSRVEKTPSSLTASVSRPEGQHPISHGQRALWFLHQLTPANSAYNIAVTARVQGQLDIPSLRQAFEYLVDRHAALRTTFEVQDGNPFQHVHQHIDGWFSVDDASDLDQDALQRHLTQEAYRPFDLHRGPLLRIRVLRRASEECILLLVVHHIVTDFWSLTLLAVELDLIYSNLVSPGRAMPNLPPIPVAYSDFVHWQAEMLSGKEGEHLWSYWQKQLAGPLPVLNLPNDRPRRAVQTYHGSRCSLFLDARLVDNLRQLGLSHGCTLYMTLLAAFQTLLFRYTGQEDILIGSPMVGRARAEFANVVGYFVNPIVLRSDLSDNPSFTELLGRVRQTVVDALKHQDYPFPLLVERLQLPRDLSRPPLFQAMLVFEKAHLAQAQDVTAFALYETGGHLALGTLSVDAMPLATPVSKFDLTLTAAETGSGVGLSMEYNSDLFERESITRMLKDFRNLLEAVVTNPDQCIRNIPLRSEIETTQKSLREKLVLPSNAFVEFKKEDIEQTIQDRFEEQVKKYPDRPAVKTGDQTWSYRALNKAANGVARAILALNPASGLRVALLLGHDDPMIPCMLGVLKTGNAFIALDPQNPRSRMEYILKDAGASILVTNDRGLQDGLSLEGLQIINLDELSFSEDIPDINMSVTPDTVAYLLYTSGSTGTPKGVIQNHRNVLHFIGSYTNLIHISPNDRLTLFASYSFDSAILDVFGAILNGASLYPINLRTMNSLAALGSWLTINQITIWHSLPTVYRRFLTAITESDQCSSLRLVVLGGEEVLSSDVSRHMASPLKDALFVALYGQSESSLTLVWTADPSLNDNRVTAGYAIDDTEVRVVNELAQETTINEVGEITITSPYLALGYWNKPELTQKAFSSGKPLNRPRTYRTGDMGRRLADGSIDFLGRIDSQVKIRGFRIELREIEVALLGHPSIREAVVIAREDQHGDKVLIAYLILRSPKGDRKPPTVSEFRRFLLERLPDYMVPSTLIIVDAFPLTSSGKVNRRDLPLPSSTRPELGTSFIAPSSRLEENLAEIWTQVLGIEKVGVHDNFFDLGGTSMSIVRVHALLRTVLGLEIGLVRLFQYSTIYSLAEYINNIEGEQHIHLSRSRAIGVRRRQRLNDARNGANALDRE